MKDIKIGFLRGIGFILATITITLPISLIFNINLLNNETNNFFDNIKENENFTLIIITILIILFMYFMYKAKTTANKTTEK